MGAVLQLHITQIVQSCNRVVCTRPNATTQEQRSIAIVAVLETCPNTHSMEKLITVNHQRKTAGIKWDLTTGGECSFTIFYTGALYLINNWGHHKHSALWSEMYYRILEVAQIPNLVRHKTQAKMYSRNDFLHVLVGNTATACAHVDSLLNLRDPKKADHSVLYLHYDDGNKIVLCCSMFIYNQPKILLIPKYLFFF